MRNDVMLTAFALGVVTGMRSLRGIAALAVEQKNDDSARAWLRSHPYWKGKKRQPIADALRSPMLANALRTGALAEGVADKQVDMPDRIDPIPLLGRVLVGGLVGAAVAELSGAEDKLAPAAAGAVGALGGAYGAWYARRWVVDKYDVDDKFVGMAEDAIAFGASKLLARRLI